MGGSVNNQAAAPNFRNIQAPVDPGIMQFAQQQFAGESMAGRDAYQAELLNQLRANTYQSPEPIWAAVQNGQQRAQEAKQTEQAKELESFLAAAPTQPIAEDPTGWLSKEEKQGSVWQPGGQYVNNGDSDGYYIDGGPAMTIDEIRQSGQAPTGQGQWMDYQFSPGGDAGGSFYAPVSDKVYMSNGDSDGFYVDRMPTPAPAPAAPAPQPVAAPQPTAQPVAQPAYTAPSPTMTEQFSPGGDAGGSSYAPVSSSVYVNNGDSDGYYIDLPPAAAPAPTPAPQPAAQPIPTQQIPAVIAALRNPPEPTYIPEFENFDWAAGGGG